MRANRFPVPPKEGELIYFKRDVEQCGRVHQLKDHECVVKLSTGELVTVPLSHCWTEDW